MTADATLTSVNHRRHPNKPNFPSSLNKQVTRYKNYGFQVSTIYALDF